MNQPINHDRLQELAQFLKAAVDQGLVSAPSWLPKAGSPVEDFAHDTCMGLRILLWTGLPVPDPEVVDAPTMWVEPTYKQPRSQPL